MTLALPTDVELVEAAAATYLADATPILQFGTDRLFKTLLPSGVTIYSFEGTHNLPGWLGDFMALGVYDHPKLNHPSLGFVHADFFVAAKQFIPLLTQAIGEGPTALSGHSRGAILALMAGAILFVSGLSVVKVGAFASPRGGGPEFVKAATSVPYCAYKYGDDPVPEVPYTRDPLFPYRQVPNLTKIGAPLPHAIDCHHIVNYVAGVKQYQAGIGAVQISADALTSR